MGECEEVIENNNNYGILWMYVVYFIVLIVIFLILYVRQLGNLPVWTSLLIASIIALVVGLIAIPFFGFGSDSDHPHQDNMWCGVFGIIIILIPIIALIGIFVSKEYHRYWNHIAGQLNNDKTKITMYCDLDGNCLPKEIKEQRGNVTTKSVFV